MKRIVLVLSMLAGVAGPALAQTTGADFGDALSPSMAAVVKAMHATIRRDLAEAAEQMPADEYAFKPTPQVRSFGELIGHVINANFSFCALAKGERPSLTESFERVNGRDALLTALKESLAYCDQVYASVTDETFNSLLTLPGPARRRASRGSVLVFNTMHNKRALRESRRLHAVERTRAAVDRAQSAAVGRSAHSADRHSSPAGRRSSA
jgi:hypothetical protein